MSEKSENHRKKEGSDRKKLAAIALIGLMLLSVVPPAAAQTVEETWTDDFEDEDVDGWESPSGETPQISSDSTEGSYSMYAATDQLQDQPQPAYLWRDGPFLDMSEEFRVEATIKPYHQGTEYGIRMGIAGADQDTEGENAFLIFNKPEGTTYVRTYANATTPDNTSAVKNDAHNNEWVNVIVKSEEGSNTLKAKVWTVGTQEPSEWLEADGFDGVAGEFAINPGNDDTSMREVWLDSVEATGMEAVDEELEIKSSSLLLHNETKEYEVYWTNPQNETVNVTDDENLTVTSTNTDGITIDELAATMTSTGNEDFNERVTIRAEYDHPESEGAAFKEVTVAKVNVENLDVLPPIYRYSATLGDDTVFFLILTILTGIVGTRFSSAFGGLSMMQMIVTIGWLGGWVGTGLAMVSVFLSLFIGFNLAVNIDYSVIR